MTAKEVLEVLAPYVPLFQTFLWVGLAIVIAFAFRRQWGELASAILKRIRAGSSFRAGPVELGPDLRSLDYASPHDSDPQRLTQEKDWNAERTSIYQHNRGVFLTHVISPSKRPHQRYDVFMYLIRHKTSDFSDVDQAEFFFGHMWGNRVFQEAERNGMIGVSTSAYGPFLCTCHVHFKDGGQINLSRYIDFEMGRAFGLSDEQGSSP